MIHSVKEKITVYLAGPMRGLPRYGFDAFESAAQDLESKGYTVISPHRMDLELGFDPSKSLEWNNFDVKDAIRRDVEAILVSDALVLLPGWEASRGATAEKSVAEWLEIPIHFYGESTL